MEDHSQEGPTKQVAQSSEVGDGAVVRVDSSGPHTVNHHTGQVEQQADLGQGMTLLDTEREREGGGGYLEQSSCEVESQELEGENGESL